MINMKLETRNVTKCYISLVTHHRRYFYYPDYNDDINKIPLGITKKREKVWISVTK